MGARIAIAVAVGCVLTALSLFYCHTGIDSAFRGAPFQFLQAGTTLSLETRYTVDFKALIWNVLIFSLAVWLLLRFFKREEGSSNNRQ